MVPSICEDKGLLCGHMGSGSAGHRAEEWPGHPDNRGPDLRGLVAGIVSLRSTSGSGGKGGGTNARTVSPAVVVETYVPSLEFFSLGTSVMPAPYNKPISY